MWGISLGYGRGSSVSCGTQHTARWGRAGTCSLLGLPDTECPHQPAAVGLLSLPHSSGEARERLPRRPGPGLTPPGSAWGRFKPIHRAFCAWSPGCLLSPRQDTCPGAARSRQAEIWHSQHRPAVLTQRPRAPSRRQRFTSAGNSFGLKQGAISSRPRVWGRNQVLFHKHLQSRRLLLALI